MKLIYRSILLVLSLTLFSAQAFSAPKAYFDQETSGWAHPHLVIDNQAYNFGQWTGAYYVNEAFSSNELAQEYIELHQNHARKAAWGIWGGLIGFLAINLTANRDENDTGLDGTYWASVGVLFGGLIYGGYQQNLSRAYLFRAINTYNEVDPATIRQDISLTFRF